MKITTIIIQLLFLQISYAFTQESNLITIGNNNFPNNVLYGKIKNVTMIKYMHYENTIPNLVRQETSYTFDTKLNKTEECHVRYIDNQIASSKCYYYSYDQSNSLIKQDLYKNGTLVKSESLRFEYDRSLP